MARRYRTARNKDLIALLSIMAGIIILLAPDLLRYLLAAYLIINGVIMLVD